MRLALLTTLALLPTAAFAQAGSQTLQASAAEPTAFVRAASPVASAATPAANTPPEHLHDVLKTTVISPVLDESIAEGGSITYTLSNSGSLPEFTGPVVTHTVGRTLPADQAANSTAHVVLSVTVDAQGKPWEIAVVRSAGAGIDKGTIDAVKQYRFKPAIYKNSPTVSHINVELELQK